MPRGYSPRCAAPQAAQPRQCLLNRTDHEPHVALFAGPTGNEVYERLIADAARVLELGGWLVMELGYRSLDAVRGMFGKGWIQVHTREDLAGYPRVIAAQWKP